MTNPQLNNLVRDLNLLKESSEFLASCLKEKNLLTLDTKTTFYCIHEKDLRPYFSSKEQVVYCYNVQGIMQKMGLQKYKPSDWRLFIDSNKRSLKCAQLHNRNEYGSIPIGHSTSMKEE